MTTTVVRTLAAAIFGAVVACGGALASTPPSAKLAQSCDAICSKRKECDARFDGEACKKRCTTLESVRKIEAFRPEATDPILACITANACDADLGAKAGKCVTDVAAKLPVSARAKALCVKLESTFNDCGIPWSQPCTAELSLFAEQDLVVFDGCVDRSCRGGVHCFRDAENGLISRQPGSPRSIRILLPPEKLPILEWLGIKTSKSL